MHLIWAGSRSIGISSNGRRPMYQLNFLSDSQTMVSIDPKKNRYRIYSVEITKLRPYRVTTRWGRKTPKHRKPRWTGTQEKEFESIKTAERHFDVVINHKLRRGYMS